MVGQHPVGRTHQRTCYDAGFAEQVGVYLHLQFGGTEAQAGKTVTGRVLFAVTFLTERGLYLPDCFADSPKFGVVGMRLEAPFIRK